MLQLYVDLYNLKQLLILIYSNEKGLRQNRYLSSIRIVIKNLLIFDIIANLKHYLRCYYSLICFDSRQTTC